MRCGLGERVKNNREAVCANTANSNTLTTQGGLCAYKGLA
jgi:hypothetical protein